MSNSPFWYGQIVDDLVWRDNQNPEKWKSPTSVKGWQQRYKVRIFTEHPKSKEELPDDALPLVDVIYPVTGGSGHAASFQSSNLRKGAYVVGIYTEEHQPIILGTYGNSEVAKLQFGLPPEGYIPFSGLYNETVPWYSIPGEGQFGQGSVYGSPNESTGFLGTNFESVSDRNIRDRFLQESSLKTSHKCAQGSGQIGAIQIAILNMIIDIEDIKKRTSYWYQGVQEWTETDIKKRIEKASKDISKELKDIIQEVRQFVTAQVNDKTKNLQTLVPPNERQKSELAVETVLDLINCLFDKVVNALISMIVDLLLSIVDRYINAPLCAIEKLAGTVIGNIFGYILGSVNKIMEPLAAIFGASAGLVPKIQGSILGFLGEVLSFLSCQNDSECPEITKWSMGGGTGTKTENFPANVQDILDQAKSIGLTIEETIDPDEFDFNLDFNDAVKGSIENCNVGPILCGPPTVEFFGGGGRGAQGNAIVSATGEILGIDMVSFGQGYTSAPLAKIVDGCGKGNGAVLLPILGSNQSGGVLNQEPISVNRDPNVDENPSITFSGGTKEIISYTNTITEQTNSTIDATWRLTSPTTVCLDVVGEGSAEIRIDMKLDDDPDDYGSSFTDAYIRGTGIDFNFGNGQNDDFDTHIFTPGCYDFIITDLIEDLELVNPKKLKLKDNDGNDANALFTISQILQDDYIRETEVLETEVVTTPLTVRDNLSPFPTTNVVEDYDYPKADTGNPIANPCAATTNISRISSYELFENYVDGVTSITPGFYPKRNGEWAHHNYGGQVNLWSSENDFIESIVTLEGGSGYGLQVLVRLEALLGRGGNPNNTRYKIISIRNHGIGYQIGDVLRFPDINGRPTRNIGDVFKITALTSLASYNGDQVETESVQVLAGGGLLTFRLYSNYDRVEPTGYYDRGLGEPAYNVWGGVVDAWGDLDDTVVLEVEPIGGTGTGMVLSMRFSAYPGRGGNPNNTTYSILEIINPGTGYSPGDRLTIPDVSFSTTPGFELSEDAVFTGDIKTLSDMGGIVEVATVSEPVFEDQIVEQEIIPADPNTVNETNLTIGIDPGGGSDVVCPPGLVIDTFNDLCNKEVKNPDLIGVIQVIVIQPGVGYTNFPDGSLGGSGRTWANAEDTVVQRIDGRWDVPYPPGTQLPDTLTICDSIYPPGNPPPLVPPPTTPPDVGEPPGVGEPPDGPSDPPPPDDPPPGDDDDPPGDPEIPDPPPPPEDPDPGLDDPDGDDLPDYPTIGDDVYDVILYLCDIYIENGGINYSPEDTITVEPSFGAIVEPIISENGVLLGVNIVSPGEGFTTRPTLTLNSTTGYNAILIPILCVDRVGDTDVIPDPINPIPVIDCVGKPLEGIDTIRPMLPSLPDDMITPSPNKVDQITRQPDISQVEQVIDCVGKHPLEDNT